MLRVLSSAAALATVPARFTRARDPVLRALWPVLSDPLLWATSGVVLGVYLFVRGFVLLQRERLISGTPQSTVRAAALGPVEISGKVVGPYTLVAPLSKADCFYFRLVTWHVQGRQRKKITIEECVPFFVEDATGRLMVDPHGANLQVPPLATQESGVISDYLRHVLTRRGIARDDLVKVEEYCIRPDDPLFVFGTLQENPWAKQQRASGLSPIGPGFLSEGEADVQRREAFEALDRLEPATATAVAARDYDLSPPVVLMDGRAPLFIANCSQRELVESWGWTSKLWIWGGPLLTLFSAYYLLQRLAALAVR